VFGLGLGEGRGKNTGGGRVGFTGGMVSNLRSEGRGDRILGRGFGGRGEGKICLGSGGGGGVRGGNVNPLR